MGQFGMKDAELLISLAQHTVGIKEGVLGIALDIRHIIAQLDVIDSFIHEIEAEMMSTLVHVPTSARLLSIKGLGVVSVAGLIGEVGDFSKFRTQSEIMKLAGLDLYEVSSGKRKGQRRISKRGRSLMRKILYYAAVLMVRKNGIMYDYYERLTGRGMLRMVALVAVSRKLLCIIHAIMRDNRDYAGVYSPPKRRMIKKAA
jgi:transposase